MIEEVIGILLPLFVGVVFLFVMHWVFRLVEYLVYEFLDGLQ